MSQNYISPAMLPLGSIAEYMDKVEGFSKNQLKIQNKLME